MNQEWTNLLTGLMLLSKGADDGYPLHCEHDELTVCTDASKFTEDEITHLAALGFTPDEFGGFHSFRFGSAR